MKTVIEELTIERGETINILGMTVRMERDRRRAMINQKRFVDNLISTYGVTKTAITPATGDLMYLREESELLEDQRVTRGLVLSGVQSSGLVHLFRSWAMLRKLLKLEWITSLL